VRRVAITGLAAVTAAGIGIDPLMKALQLGEPLGAVEEIRGPRNRILPVRVARAAEFDPGPFLAPGALRRMAPESRLLTTTCVMAMRDAGADRPPISPGRTGTFTGSGFGCLRSTEEYLGGIFRDGMAAASPQLFGESLASAPAGHTAIAIDARGMSVAFQGGDASMIVALSAGWRAIRAGRIDRAVCGSFELMSPTLLSVLARLSARSAPSLPPFFGEGAVAIVLEDLDAARGAGARVHAELRGLGLSGDTGAGPRDWSHDEAAWADAHARALRSAAGGEGGIGVAFRHAPPSPAAARAEGRALDRLEDRHGAFERRRVDHVVGALAGAGGIAAAAAAMTAFGSKGLVLVRAGAWGGVTAAAVMSGP